MIGLSYKYSIGGGETQSTHSVIDAHLQTTGFWIETFLNNMKQNLEQNMVIMIDEAHDASWQTDFVLNLILWFSRQNPNVKIVISSATLDIQNMLMGEKYIVLNVEQEAANVERSFLSNAISLLDHAGKITQSLIDEIINKIRYCLTIMNVKERRGTDGINNGHILIIMPGQGEIDILCEEIAQKIDIGNFTEIVPLHSQLQKDAIEHAISSQAKRKIIVSTNIVENAITIEKVAVVIDSCLRKLVFIDEDGVQELKLSIASQSNIIQACGRTGRQGIRGKAYIMLIQNAFEQNISKFVLSESQRNPVYEQIIKIVKHNLPFDILQKVDKAKLQKNIEYLIKNDILTNTGGKIQLTPYGEDASRLPCGIKIAKFIVNMLKVPEVLGNHEMIYCILLIASWMQNKFSPFYNPPKKFDGNKQQNENDYRKLLDEINKKHFPLYRKDDLVTFLNVWRIYYSQTNYNAWAHENFIFEKNLNLIDRTKNDLMRSVLSFGIKLSSKYSNSLPTNTDKFNFENFVNDLDKNPNNFIVVKLREIYKFDIYIQKTPPEPFSGKQASFIKPYMGNNEIPMIYVLDRNTKNLYYSYQTFDKYPGLHKIIPFGVTKKGNMVFLTNIIIVED